MSEINYTEVIYKAIRRTNNLNKYQKRNYTASGGSESAWAGMMQLLNVEVSLGVSYCEYVRITMKPNGDIFLSGSPLSDLGIKIENPENEDEIVEQAIRLLDEILATEKNYNIAHQKDHLVHSGRSGKGIISAPAIMVPNLLR